MARNFFSYRDLLRLLGPPWLSKVSALSTGHGTVREKVPGFRRWLCRNCFSQHDVGFLLQRVVRIEDQGDLPGTPLLDHHRMLQEVTTHRGEVHRLVTPW